MNENAEDSLKNLKELKNEALSCVHCGQCRVAQWPMKGIHDVCPVYKTEITPKFEPFFSRGKNVILKGLLWGDISLSKELSEIINQCSLCGACKEFCFNAHNENIAFSQESWMNQVEVYEALRADLVEAGFGLESHFEMNEAMVRLLNPYNRDNKEKEKWTEELDFQIKNAAKEKADLIYFVGCTAALTPQIRQVAVATAKILHKLDVDFAIFGEHEVCCGSVAMRTGDRKAFNEVATKNTELFEKSGAKTIITSCAGCYRTLKLDYADYLEDSDIEILHTIEYLIRILEKKGIKLKNLGHSVTYHDPCHTGRHMGDKALYDEPRKILNEICSLNEMKTIREGAMCCGAGGGVKKAFPELSLEMAKNRVEEAEATGAKLLVSTCPFCFRNLSDAINAANSEMEMVDLVNLILEALDEE
ncbi:MAG: (Fe-S)-binding protein [Promethearchaeota archaeon]|nr:MAG: (Fe-S)-binding protein [Candidatus Lokiarchaeota archaeon]